MRCRRATRCACTCALPRGLKASAFWRDGDGQVTALAPATTTAGDFVDRLTYPSKDFFPVPPGRAGMSLFLICGRFDGTPPRLEEVEKHVEPDRPWPPLPGGTLGLLLLLQTERVEVKALASTDADRVGAVQKRLERLRQQLRTHFDFVAGVAVPYREGK